MITNQSRKRAYTVLAPLYDVIVLPLRRRRARAVELAALKPGERILVVGAGTGLDLPFIPKGCVITAIDLTPAMLAHLQGRARKHHWQVDSRVMDAQDLGFPDESFDVVLLHLILAVVPDPALAIREAARVLRTGGRATIFDKFAPDGRRAPLLLRLVSPFVRRIATEVTRQLRPLLREVPELKVEHDEAAGVGGFFRIILLKKQSPTMPASPTASAMRC